MLNEIISSVKESSGTILESTFSNSLDEILDNIELFNVGDKNEYSIDDFKDDLLMLQISFNLHNIVSLFDSYKENNKKDS